MTLEQKEQIKQKVAQGMTPRPALLPASVRSSPQSDELLIQITGNDLTVSLLLRPHEISRLRGRYGNGPGFEQWVLDRIQDGLNTLGGG